MGYSNHIPKLRGGDVCVLAGAGISRGSGFPLAYEITDELTNISVRPAWAADAMKLLTRWERSSKRSGQDVIRFEMFIDWFQEVFDPTNTLFGFVDAFKMPCSTHHALAAWNRSGASLVTVNFDDLLERAMHEIGIEPHTLDGHSRSAQPHSTLGEGIVCKLHGSRRVHSRGRTRLNPRPLHATITAIAAANPVSAVASRAAEILRANTRGRTLVVAGYSGSDDLDIIPILNSCAPKRVVWIDHADASPSTVREADWVQLPQRFVQPLTELSSGGAGVTVISGRTDEALARLSDGVAVSEIDRPATPVAWRQLLRDWFEPQRHNDPTGLGFCGLVFGHSENDALAVRSLLESKPSTIPNGSWPPHRRAYEIAQNLLISSETDIVRSQRWARKSLKLAESEAPLPKTWWLSKILLGRLAFLVGDFEEARSQMSAVIDIYPDGSNASEYATSWLGRTEAWSDNFKAAVPLLVSARSHFERVGDLESVLDAENGLAVAYIGLGCLDDAQRSVARQEEISTRFSFLSRRACAFVNRAEIEFARSNLDEALRCLSFADADFQTSQDLSEVWTSCLLHGVIWRELGDLATSAKYFRDALKSPAIWSETDRRLALAELSESLLLSGNKTAARRTAGLVGTSGTNDRDWAQIHASLVIGRSGADREADTSDEPLSRYAEPSSVPTRVEHAMSIYRLKITGSNAKKALEKGAEAACGLGDRKRCELLRSAIA